MAQKQIYKSARGKEVDMIKLVKQNEMTLAVGNAKVNARGDKIGPNGQIIKTREQIIAERSGGIPEPAQLEPQPISEVIPVAPVVLAPPTPAPISIPVPATPIMAGPVTPVAVKKDIANMDPEGKE
jgi:hypothetical protein